MFFRVGVEPSLLKMNVKVIKFYTFYNPKKLIFYQLNARVAQYMAGKRPLKFWTWILAILKQFAVVNTYVNT
jgi:hypothetical protein